jgi:hypothetical protein
MKKALPVLALLSLALGCRHPEVEAFRQRPVPIVVKLDLRASIPGSESIKREYEAALRSRLASRATVVVDGVAAPPAYAELLVAISDIRPSRSDPNPAAVGIATGAIVGTLGALAGNRNATFDGFWWGLWAGTHAAAERRWEERSLGYRPNRINAVVYLRQPDPSAAGKWLTLAEFDVDGYEVIESMTSLYSAERDDLGRVREEEARALASVIVRKLAERFDWPAKPQQDFYGLRKVQEPEPIPKREGEAREKQP